MKYYNACKLEVVEAAFISLRMHIIRYGLRTYTILY